MVSAKTLLIHCRHSPYRGTLAKTSIDVAMAAAAFEQPITLLFSGDGVWQLVAHQQPPGGEKNHGKFVSALPLYGIESVYVDRQSLALRGLDVSALCVPVELIEADAVCTLMASCDQVFNF